MREGGVCRVLWGELGMGVMHCRRLHATLAFVFLDVSLDCGCCDGGEAVVGEETGWVWGRLASVWGWGWGSELPVLLVLTVVEAADAI